MSADKIMPLALGAQRIGKSVRTLWRWQSLGLLRILPGGYVYESELVRAEAEVRRRRIMARHIECHCKCHVAK